MVKENEQENTFANPIESEEASAYANPLDDKEENKQENVFANPIESEQASGYANPIENDIASTNPTTENKQPSVSSGSVNNEQASNNVNPTGKEQANNNANPTGNEQASNNVNPMGNERPRINYAASENVQPSGNVNNDFGNVPTNQPIAATGAVVPGENPSFKQKITNLNLKQKAVNLDKKYKIIILAVIGVVLIICLVNLIIWFNNGRVYSQAEKHLESKEYAEAISVLKPLVEKEYKDSATFTEYIKTIQELNEAESVMDNTFQYDTFNNLATTFESFGDFKDSKHYKEYALATNDFARNSVMSTENHKEYGEKYGKAGEINGANYLSAFFTNLYEKKYDEAIESAKEYKEAGGILLTSKKISAITSVNFVYNTNETDTNKVNTRLNLKHVAFSLDEKAFENLTQGFLSDTIKSLDLKGLGSKPNGKVLVLSKITPYKGSANYDVYYTYTTIFGRDMFPRNIEEVEYVVRVYENEKFDEWYLGGGKKVPGVTQSVYAELYDIKTKKVIAKSQTINGPALKKKYTYSGPTPDIIRPDWNEKGNQKKKAIKQLVEKIPKNESKA